MRKRQRTSSQRILALFLAGSMLAATGCGSSKEEVEEVQETQTEDGREDAGLTELFPEVPQILFSPVTDDCFAPDSGQWLLHAEYDTVKVTDGGSQKVTEAVRQWSDRRAEEIQELIETYTLEAAENEGMTEADDYYRYSIFHELQTARVDERVISLIEMNSEYTGGAHGSYGSRGITFDAQSGQILDLSDIVADEEGFQEYAETYIIETLSRTYAEELFPEYEDVVRRMWDYGGNWCLDAAGITFIFQPYELGPYTMGEAFVTLPYAEAEPYLSDSYILGRYHTHMGAGVARIPSGEELSLFLSATDSQQEKFRLYVDEGEYGPVHLELNHFSIETDPFERIGDAYLVCQRDGGVFVVFDADYASDDFVTFVFELTEGTIEECDRQEGLSLQGGVLNTDSLRLCMRLDVFGTYRSLMDYSISQEGRLEAFSEWFEIPETSDPWHLLTTVRGLPVWIEDEETVLPAGSHIRITATNNSSAARFTDKDTGRNGEIRYVRGNGEEDSWTIYVNERADYEYFETIPYTG